jgi:hypothetical protein
MISSWVLGLPLEYWHDLSSMAKWLASSMKPTHLYKWQRYTLPQNGPWGEALVSWRPQNTVVDKISCHCRETKDGAPKGDFTLTGSSWGRFLNRGDINAWGYDMDMIWMLSWVWDVKPSIWNWGCVWKWGIPPNNLTRRFWGIIFWDKVICA